MIPEGWQEILVTDAVYGPRSCVVPNTLVWELKKLKAFKEKKMSNIVQLLEDRLRICEEHKAEFVEQRDNARQLAYTLAEYIKATERGVQVAYPVDAIAQVDLARGVAGRYEFPAQGRSIPEIVRNQRNYEAILRESTIPIHPDQSVLPDERTTRGRTIE